MSQLWCNCRSVLPAGGAWRSAGRSRWTGTGRGRPALTPSLTASSSHSSHCHLISAAPFFRADFVSQKLLSVWFCFTLIKLFEDFVKFLSLVKNLPVRPFVPRTPGTPRCGRAAPPCSRWRRGPRTSATPRPGPAVSGHNTILSFPFPEC